MKAVVLGGAGVIGSYAVEYLSKTGIFSEISIADISKAHGKEISKKYENTTYVHMDATDKASLANTMKGADVIINCVGPFYRFAPLILKTAIAEGVNYVDVCDDYDTTQILIDDYHAQALDAGTTCIVGLGASPGLTNIIAAHAASQLTSVSDITIYVTRGILEEAGGAIPYHMMHCWLGPVPVYKNGNLQKARGLLDGEEWVTFPEPFGQAPVYYFGHPETVTIPRYIKGVRNVCCKGTFFPAEFRRILLQLEELGLLSEQPLNIKNHQLAPRDFLASYIPILAKHVIESGVDIPVGGAVIIKVKGMVQSQPMTLQFAGTSRMRGGTATPAALGAVMLGKGAIKKPGVYAPEGCVPPREFINNLMEGKLFGDTWLTITQKLEGPI